MRAFAFGFAHLYQGFDPHTVPRDTPLLLANFYVSMLFILHPGFTTTLGLDLNSDLTRSSTKRVVAAIIYSGIIP